MLELFGRRPKPWHNRPNMPESQPHDARLHWESQCMARARAGDRAAFAELYRAFAPALYERVLLPKLGSSAAAEDALSETFRSLLEHIGELEIDERGLWPWLFRVATNKALDQHRSKSRSARALVNCERLLAPLLGAADGFSAPDLAAQRSRLARNLQQLVAALSARHQQALELRFLRELPREQCAAQMQLSVGAFDVLLLRALRALRAQWELHFTPSDRGEP